VALRHVLYRCPLCGHDPTVGERDRAACTSCGSSFRRGARGVWVRGPAGEENVSVIDLVDGIRAWGGAMSAATGTDGTVHYSARARYHGWLVESPLSASGRTLGYVDQRAPGVRGVLEVDDQALAFRPAQGTGAAPEARPGGEPRHGGTRWPLAEISALQVSTRSLQVGVRRLGTAEITLPEGSTFRWEELLQELLRRTWRRLDRGEITEFQPRVTGR